MATWLVHIRIADMLLNKFRLPRHDFLAGNIAPDCSFPDGNGGFDPPAAVTHWTKTGKKGDCDYAAFAEKMLPLARNEGERALLLGCYSHLITDCLWVRDIVNPAKLRFPELYQTRQNEFYRLAKADWYDNDAAFLAANPDYPALLELAEIRGYDSSVFPYYGRDNIQIQIEYILGFYRSKSYDGREFVYITTAQVDEFVLNAAGYIGEKLERII